MSIFKEFKEFVGQGNAVDLAVGVIIGSAMTGILKSFVDEMVVPLTGLLGKVDFANSYLVLKGAVAEGLPLAEARKVAGAVVLGYGQFLTVAFNTLILAFVVFLCVRTINRIKKTQEAEEAAAPPEPSPQEVLLAEIRDILAKRESV
ncbi:MAG: large conductance mechanosensitive channel protein MscL [Candidatus Eremiobacteraeota bacterium]|nr:large conductance mechanosensitive channel protein MscL [Candidatus Eremiobacteraeota bacterium]MCW5868434.1 large conductance mechanosensitive channel protein MscL [Candidatus Eremiobacteraeota bacterium]